MQDIISNAISIQFLFILKISRIFWLLRCFVLTQKSCSTIHDRRAAKGSNGCTQNQVSSIYSIYLNERTIYNNMEKKNIKTNRSASRWNAVGQSCAVFYKKHKKQYLAFLCELPTSAQESLLLQALTGLECLLHFMSRTSALGAKAWCHTGSCKPTNVSTPLPLTFSVMGVMMQRTSVMFQPKKKKTPFSLITIFKSQKSWFTVHLLLSISIQNEEA